MSGTSTTSSARCRHFSLSEWHMQCIRDFIVAQVDFLLYYTLFTSATVFCYFLYLCFTWLLWYPVKSSFVKISLPCLCLFRAVTMHDRPARMFADLDVAGRHELFHRLDIFQYVLFKQVTWWCYWQGNRLVIRRSRVWVLALHYWVVALGKLLTPVCLCHQEVHFGIDQEGWSLFYWESNRRPGGK